MLHREGGQRGTKGVRVLTNGDGQMHFGFLNVPTHFSMFSGCRARGIGRLPRLAIF